MTARTGPSNDCLVCGASIFDHYYGHHAHEGLCELCNAYSADKQAIATIRVCPIGRTAVTIAEPFKHMPTLSLDQANDEDAAKDCAMCGVSSEYPMRVIGLTVPTTSACASCFKAKYCVLHETAAQIKANPAYSMPVIVLQKRGTVPWPGDRVDVTVGRDGYARVLHQPVARKLPLPPAAAAAVPVAGTCVQCGFVPLEPHHVRSIDGHDTIMCGTCLRDKIEADDMKSATRLPPRLPPPNNTVDDDSDSDEDEPAHAPALVNGAMPLLSDFSNALSEQTTRLHDIITRMEKSQAGLDGIQRAERDRLTARVEQLESLYDGCVDRVQKLERRLNVMMTCMPGIDFEAVSLQVDPYVDRVQEALKAEQVAAMMAAAEAAIATVEMKVVECD